MLLIMTIACFGQYSSMTEEQVTGSRSSPFLVRAQSFKIYLIDVVYPLHFLEISRGKQFMPFDCLVYLEKGIFTVWDMRLIINTF